MKKKVILMTSHTKYLLFKYMYQYSVLNANELLTLTEKLMVYSITSADALRKVLSSPLPVKFAIVLGYFDKDVLF